ncbi:hypothetical protein H4S06_003181 [Coemansia sp. BCRC 34490]|nr:hypothetical protein H4S06_003181 [Coemansia sp. BCRC 34490]
MSGSGFFSSKAFAVVGASADRAKYGNRVLRWYIDNKLPVTPINARADGEIEGLASVKALGDLQKAQQEQGGDALLSVSVSVVTPQVSQRVVEEAAALGIRHMWFQPGSEPDALDQLGEKYGIQVIGNGPCILVEGERMLLAQEARL